MNKGDKLVCVDNSEAGTQYEINKLYEISDIMVFSDGNIYHQIHYGSEIYKNFWFINIKPYFITLAEWRDRQIDEILKEDI